MNTRSLVLRFTFALLSTAIVAGIALVSAQDPHASAHDTAAGDQLLSRYFASETEKLTDRVFADIETLEDWLERRGEYRRQLFEMLGLDPLPERTPLRPTVTGQRRQDDFIVENLHFQSRPGLYVTANLYRPAEQDGPLPAVLYVCGHGRVKKDGVSYGNKTNYQHHGAWFARHGYVCLTIDTIQLGEIEGIHHGTYREKMWWWNNRGYSPAGVEAWNCIRSLDYLQSRPEVDGERIGVTGRSGGGAYSWWVAALDDRIKVAVPVAGITSLHNHVVDGCVEGHCDCMYMVNTYRWDYPMVAALVAPRPLLISNSDKDRIFPLDGVVDVHGKVRKIYRLFDANDKLGLQITEGPHKDTQELRVHAFRWFNRFLKDDERLIENTAIKFFEPEQLKVFEQLPDDEIVTTVHESFVPSAPTEPLPPSSPEYRSARRRWMSELTQKTFGGWPSADEAANLEAEVTRSIRRDGIQVREVKFLSQSPYRLTMFAIGPTSNDEKNKVVRVNVLDQNGWRDFSKAIAIVFPNATDDQPRQSQPSQSQFQAIVDEARSHPNRVTVYVLPRGVGPTEWSRDERERTQIRRRFMQLGQTAASMQIWDVRRALQAIESLPDLASGRREIHASGQAAVWALYASLFEPRIDSLELDGLPAVNRDAPDLLNVSRIVQVPQIVLMASDRINTIRLRVDAKEAADWRPIAESGHIELAVSPL